MITNISIPVDCKSQWGSMNFSMSSSFGLSQTFIQTLVESLLYDLGTSIELYEEIISEIWAIKPFPLVVVRTQWDWHYTDLYCRCSTNMNVFVLFFPCLSSQSLSAIWEPSFTSLNFFANSKPDPGGGISDLGTLKLSAKWQPGARVSICTLQHIGQLFQQIRFAQGMRDTKECFPMNYCVWKCFVRCWGL